MQHKRVLALAAILALVSVVTGAFAQGAAVQYADAQTTVSRAGAVALLVEADPVLKARLPYHISHTPPMPLFDDVNYEEWYAPYIETAFEAGVITGNAERLFRPGDALSEEEMIALGARYRSIERPEVYAEMMSNTSSWFDGAVIASVHGGLTLPSPIRLGQPARRSDFYALMQSMSIQNPAQIALSHRPAPVVVARQPVIARPQNVQPRPQNPAPANPRPQNPAPAQPAGPQPSAKPFAISLPTLGVKDLTITHPSDPFTKDGLLAPLKYGVGHLFSYPGKGGKILVYGHSSSYPWDVSDYTKIFRQINKLNVGDLIHVTYGGKVHTYKVSYKQTVPADDVSAYGSGGGEELILYTCWPPDSIKERYLVHAVPVAN